MAFTIPSLFEPDLKRQWASKHLQALKLEIEHFSDSNPYKISIEENANSGEYSILLTHPELANALPAVLIFGDFVNNLRACLDYLAWQLVIQNGQIQTMETCFPMSHRGNHDGRRMISRAVVGMSDAAIAIIDSFQPYHAGDDYKLSHLWRLATLCNIQKHRQVSPFATQPPWQFCLKGDPLREAWTVRSEQIDNCTIMHFPLAAKDYIEFKPEGTKADLRFIDSEAGIDVGYQDLLEMYNFVTNEVIPSFVNIFPNPDVPWHSPQG